jgi:flagellar protein FlaG
METGALQNNTQAITTAPTPVIPTRSADLPEVIQAVKAVNEAELFGQQNEATFTVDRQTRRTVVQIVNRQTNEVIRQIPPESLLRVAEDMKLLDA